MQAPGPWGSCGLYPMVNVKKMFLEYVSTLFMFLVRHSRCKYSYNMLQQGISIGVWSCDQCSRIILLSNDDFPLDRSESRMETLRANQYHMTRIPTVLTATSRPPHRSPGSVTAGQGPQVSVENSGNQLMESDEIWWSIPRFDKWTCLSYLIYIFLIVQWREALIIFPVAQKK